MSAPLRAIGRVLRERLVAAGDLADGEFVFDISTPFTHFTFDSAHERWREQSRFSGDTRLLHGRLEELVNI